MNLEKAERKAIQFLEKRFAAKSVVANEVRAVGMSPLLQIAVRGTFELAGVKESFEIMFESGWLCRMVGWKVTPNSDASDAGAS